ncbi:MAG: ABC transporter permease [Candidatus Thermoplasmatota archaeon]
MSAIYDTLRDIYTLWLREMTRYVRMKSRIVATLGMPVLWLLLLGTAFKSSMRLGPNLGVDYITFMAPGIVAMTILFTSLFAGTSVIFDREFGFLKEILVAPVSKTSIILGKGLGGTTTAFIQGIIIIFLSIPVGASYSGDFGLALGIVAALGVMFFVALGIVFLGIAVASRIESMEGFQMLMNFLVMPLFFLSGALYPIGPLPGWLKALAYIDPLTYCVDALRHLLIGGAASQFPLWQDLLVLLAFCGAMLALGTVMFKRERD